MTGRRNGEPVGSWIAGMIRGRGSEVGTRNAEGGTDVEGRPATRPSHGCSAFRVPRSAFMRVVAVFGGGGAKSLAHAGAWKALLEAGLRPSHIVGTSMGAVIGAAFAAGSTYDRLVGIALSLHRNDFAALDAWALAKGVFAQHLEARAVEAHDCASRSRHALRR